MDDDDSVPNCLNNPAKARRYVLGGRGKITLMSVKDRTKWFSYKMRRPDDDGDDRDRPVFVSVLTGSNNDDDYTYFGQFWPNLNWNHGKKSRIGPNAPSAKVWDWFWRRIILNGEVPEELGLEVWHEGVCGRCGRTLTVPESIKTGFGPVCITMED